MNLDTLSSDSSEEEIRDSGRSFQSLIVWGKNLCFLKHQENDTVSVFGLKDQVRYVIFVNLVILISEYGIRNINLLVVSFTQLDVLYHLGVRTRKICLFPLQLP